jgi:hypothetical protein
MATRILLWFFIIAGLLGVIKDLRGQSPLAEEFGNEAAVIGDLVFIAIGALGLWVMRNDKYHQNKAKQ